MSEAKRVRVKRTDDRRLLRFAGLEFAPPLTADETAAMEQQLQQALASGNYSQMPPPRDASIAVWRDAAGQHYVMLADEEGNPVAVPFRVGPRRDPRRDDLGQGGFVPAKLLEPTKQRPDVSAGQLAAASLAGGGDSSGSGGGGVGGEVGGERESALQRQDRKSELILLLQSGIQGLAQGAGGELLGALVKTGGSVDGLASGALSEGLLTRAGASLANVGIGGLLSAGTGALFSTVWGVDDSSSMGEQLAHKYAQELADILQSELQEQTMSALFGGGEAPPNLGPKDWQETFLGIDAPAGVPVVRKGDKTDHGGNVVSGAATVLVEGMMVARMTDEQLCPKKEPGPIDHVGGKIDQGVTSVLVEGELIARDQFASICTGCGLAAHVLQGQSSVQVGGVATPPPKENQKAAPQPSATRRDGGSGAPESREGQRSQDVKEVPKGESGDGAPREGEQDSVLSGEGDPEVSEGGSLDEGEVDPVGFGEDNQELNDAEKEILKDLAEHSGDARRAVVEAERGAMEEAAKLRWGQILAIEEDIARGGGSPERLASLQMLRQKLLNMQFRDVPDEAMRFRSLANQETFLRGVTTTVGGLFALDELMQTDAHRQEYIRKYGRQASWEHDMGQATKFIASMALAIPNRLGIGLNIGLPVLAEGVGREFGRLSYEPIKWVADRLKTR